MARSRFTLPELLLVIFALGMGSVALVAAQEGKPAAEQEMAAAPAEKPAVVEGEVVDMKCYVGMDMPGGGKHHECAVKCAKMGSPAGVVDKDGQVFTVLAPAGGLADLMGKTVRITGVKAEKSTAILPEKVEVRDKDKWTEFKLPEGMM
jgi:hypothetical protein